MRKLLLTVVLLVLPAPSWAQCMTNDQVGVSTAQVFNSPADMMRWCQTAVIQSVTFNADSWPVTFNRMDGADRWPDVTTPGWDGPLQYTLGICRLSAPVACSAVVQFWYGRQGADPKATAAPNDIAKEWFYDGRWGSLAGYQPALGESVGVFVCRGDCRGNDPQTHERSNVVVVKWGNSQRFEYDAPPAPQPVPQPGAEPPPGVDNLTSRVNWMAQQIAQMRELIGDLKYQVTQAREGVERIDAYLASKPIMASCSASLFGLPVSCALR